jgi:biotin-independent malonate decarboxylase gamma subunit
MSEFTGIRGPIWFEKLTGTRGPLPGDTASVWTADLSLDGEQARFLAVVTDPESRFPRARHGELGIEQAATLAARVREVIAEDQNKPQRRSLVSIVDVKSQAYGRREEMLGIHQGAAMVVDAYASARMAGHPVVALIVGHAFSGAFLAHGYQANRILAFGDEGVMIHAMHKEAAARITRRTIEDLDRLGSRIYPLSYSIRDYARLGMLHELLPVTQPDQPLLKEIEFVKERVLAAIRDARSSAPDLSNRLQSPEAKASRRSTLRVREVMMQQWESPK